MKFSTVFLTIAIMISICTSVVSPAQVSAQANSSDAEDRLTNTEWRLVRMGRVHNQLPVIEGTVITLKFGTDGRVGGSGGCNTYGGDYRVLHQDISFSQIVSTKRACLDPRANQQEQTYFGALGSARNFRLSRLGLEINYSLASRLNFESASESSSSPQRYEDLSNPTALLASFYNAVNLRDYERAYSYWESPASGLREFSIGYRDTVNVQLIVQPPTNFEGAAGSSYSEVPTVIVSRQRNGSQRTFAGCYVIRKSNLSVADNPGAGAWRIYQGRLSPAAASALIPRLLLEACQH